MSENQEINRLRAENEQLKQENQRLQQRIQELERLTKTLEDRLTKTSRTSHKPPSSDGWGKKTRTLRHPSGKKAGGQPGHPGSHLAQVATPDHVVELHPAACPGCGHAVSEPAGMCQERRQVFDIPVPRLEVTEYQAMQVECAHCGMLLTAEFPAEVKAATQYGERVRALGVYLHQYHFVPFQRVAEALKDLCGCPISPGSVANWVMECATRLASFEAGVREVVRTGDVQHNDETGLFVNGHLHWLHVASTSQVTLYWLHPRRGEEGIAAGGTLLDYHGVSIHDGWKPYEKFPCVPALCHAHLLRELAYIAERYHQPWATQLSRLFITMKQSTDAARARREPALPMGLQLVYWKRYWAIVNDGWLLNLPRERDGPPTRGRIKQSEPTNLLIRLREQAQAVLLFIEDLRVPFDNNQGERDIRPTKVRQKVSGGFRSFSGGEAFCRIRGFVSTLRKQGRAAFDGLLQTFYGACLPVVLPS